MKAKFLLVGVGVAMFALTSCKKDYTCECTTTNGTTTVTTSTVINGKKKDVEAACVSQNVTAGTTSVTCEIK